MFKRRNLSIAVALMAAALAAVPANGQPQDVTGWGRIKWGMTIQEAQTLYSDLQPIQTDQKLVFNDFELTPSQVANVTLYAGKDGVIFDVGMFFTKAGGKIGGLNIEGLFGAVPANARRMIFDEMKKLLLEKYGAPKSDETRMDGTFETTKVLWIFPSTSIELDLHQSVRFAQFGHVAIGCTSARKNPL